MYGEQEDVATFEKPERQDCLVEKVNNRMSLKHGYMGISSG